MVKLKQLTSALLLILLVALVSGCGPEITDQEGNTLVLAYDGWSGTYLPMYVLKVILEDELGYTVKISDQSTIPDAFKSVSTGQTHVFTSAWFPIRDSTFNKYPDLVKLGQAYGGSARDAYEGWMISSDIARRYDVAHVSDLRNPEVVKALDTDGDGRGNLINCPQDWVCAGRNPEILEGYELGDMYEIEAQLTEKDFIETVQKRILRGEPALFYMLRPVSFPDNFSIADRAVWLDGTEAYLPLSFNRAVVRTDFIVNHPRAAVILREYRIPGADIGWAMGRIAEEGDSEKLLTELAEQWIETHRAEVDSWLTGLRN